MTVRQKLILFLISCDPGIRSIYNMIKLYDRADFPSEINENLNPLLDNGFIYVSKNFDNGTPGLYEVTEKGKAYLAQYFNDDEIMEHIKTMQNPDSLLKITQAYIDKKNG